MGFFSGQFLMKIESHKNGDHGSQNISGRLGINDAVQTCNSWQEPDNRNKTDSLPAGAKKAAFFCFSQYKK